MILMMMMAECDGQKGHLVEHVNKVSPPPFLLKTYMLVEDPATDEVVSWNHDGTAFVVWRTAEFARDLLPVFFKHCNFSSFVRQLNTYGFRKIATSRWEFSNDMFQKGKRDQLCKIHRRKTCSNKTQSNAQDQSVPILKEQLSGDNYDRRSSSTSSSSELTTLIDENKRLKEENGTLNSELANMKKKCKELLDLVARFDGEKLERKKKETIDEEKINEGPKLFGVRLEVEGKMENKRKKGEISESVGVILSQSCK